MDAVLLNAWLAILRAWTPAFSQARSSERAIQQALGSLLALGRRTLSRSLWALGRQHQDWSADYKLHSRAVWQTRDLFQPILEQAAGFCDDSLLVVAMDDTRIRKTGRKILTAFYQRDPLSPKFRFNLMWGLRFLHFSLLVPLYRSNADVPPRSLPVRFLEVPAIQKPGKKASDADMEAYRAAVKQHNLSRRCVDLLKELRQSVDAAGLASRTILAVGDASFCNRTHASPWIASTSWPALAATAGSATGSNRADAAFTPPRFSLPIRFACGNRFPGNRPAFFMGGNGVMSGIKK